MANTSKSKKKKDEVVTKNETKKTPSKVAKTKEKSDSIKKEEIVKEEVNLNEKIETPKKSHGMYIGLPLRIMGRILLVLLLLSFGTYLLLKTISLESGKSVSYTEKSNIDYSVCLRCSHFRYSRNGFKDTT